MSEQNLRLGWWKWLLALEYDPQFPLTTVSISPIEWLGDMQNLLGRRPLFSWRAVGFFHISVPSLFL